MTRDEAIRAMRKGKKVIHKTAENEVWTKEDIGFIRPAFLSEEFDDGWEIYKRKVKKTRWCIIREEYNPTINLATDQLFVDKKEAERCFPEANGYKHCPIEIEVEE